MRGLRDRLKTHRLQGIILCCVKIVAPITCQYLCCLFCQFVVNNDQRVIDRSERNSFMRIKVLDDEVSFCRIEILGTTDALCNQIRWCLTRDLRTAAITSVDVIKNTSPFPSEYVAHRIGMMPLVATSLHAREGELRLKSDTPGHVCADELRGEHFQVVCKDAIVTSLPLATSIELVAHVGMGMGKDHEMHNHVAAARVERRTQGTCYEQPECWCDSTDFGEHCKLCNGIKRLAHQNETAHLIAFETIGAVRAIELFKRALRVTLAKCASLSVAISNGQIACET
jgi:hypothetical protein